MIAALVVAVVVLFAGVVALAFYMWALRDTVTHIDGLHHGLRRDHEAAMGTLGSNATLYEERHCMTEAHIKTAQQTASTALNTAAVANDRILYYTRRDRTLNTLGKAYDKAITKIVARAKAERDAQDAAEEGTAQSEGVVGAIGTPCG